MEPCRLYKQIMADPAGRAMLDQVFDDDNNWGVSADVDPTCMIMGGNTYELLAKIIPRNRVVYDFGAAYGFQSWYFRHHKRYIAVQYSELMPFRTDNSIWFFGSIQDYFKRFGVEDNSFAICNYVPDHEAERLVRENCPHLFVNYVVHEDLQDVYDKIEVSRPPRVG